MNIRIIPRLDIKGANLVKGIHFEGLRVMGKPQDYARAYYENGADELVYIDAVASLYGRNSLLDIVEKTSEGVFIPLTVGGGIRSVSDIREVLKAGADKVSLNTAALQNPGLIREAARMFGSAAIVVSIEAVRHGNGRYEAYTDYGRESSGKDAFQWALQAVEFGAGELMVTSINQEGTGRGFDCEWVRKIASAASVPVVASGGAGNIEHVYSVIREGRADGVCLASLLHYHAVKDFVYHPEDFSEEGNTEFLLRTDRSFSVIQGCSLRALKEELIRRCVPCRPPEWVCDSAQEFKAWSPAASGKEARG